MRFFLSLLLLLTAAPATAQTSQPPAADLPEGVAPMDFPAVIMTMVTETGEFPLFLELAQRPDQRARGLKYRADLPDDYGMLFIFPDAQPRQFWMQDTPSPLDIIFIGEDYVIDSIREGIPYSERRLPSDGPVKFVLELRQGLAEVYGLTPGSSVTFQ